MSELTHEPAADRPPRPAGLEFPNPSGRSWFRRESKDVKPDTPKEPKTERNETPAQRKRRVSNRVGKTYVGIAKMTNQFGAEYPSKVLLSQAEPFNDALMGMAEEHPRILEWLDSEYLVPATWQFVGVCIAITVSIAAYYGFVPEFIGELACDAFDVPALPEEQENVIVQPRVNGSHE